MSIQINISHLNFSYTDVVKILEDVNLTLTPGWSCVVGANGCGKTTFLKLLAGFLSFDSGQISSVPDNILVDYCAQSVENTSEKIISFSQSWSKKCIRLQARLALDPDQIKNWESLSPGERKRWQIGAALSTSPELLLLDEPTNHLDYEARNLLASVLKSFRGIGVIVSHDRDFIDGLCQSTVRFAPGGDVKLYTGNYSQAQQQWIDEENNIADKKRKLNMEQKTLKRRLDSSRRSQLKADSDKSPKHRMKSVRDHDARSMAKKGRAIKAEQKLGKSVGVLKAKLDKATTAKENLFIHKTLGRSLFVIEKTSPKQDIVCLRQDQLLAGDKLLINNLDLLIKRQSRIRLHGKNGSGKTTLIKELINASTLPEDKILYLPQEISTEETLELLESARKLPSDIRGRLLQIVAALGVSPQRLIDSELPSPGEIRKLKLAMGLSLQAWLLILDEPTNHLDLPSIIRIEEALKNYNGAILLVSHDQRFADEICDLTWKIENQELVLD